MWYLNETSGNYVLQATEGNIVIKGELLGDLPEEKMNAKCDAFVQKAIKDGTAFATEDGAVLVGFGSKRKYATGESKLKEIDVTRQKPVSKVNVKINIKDLD